MGLVRSWVIRFAILAVLAAGLAAVRVAHDRVSPDRVRAALVAALEEQFPAADVAVESASLRVFGGISVRKLRLTRKGEAEPFFAAEAAVISHDKQQLHRGQLVIRKVEFDAPTVRADRRPDGTWNVAGVFRLLDPHQPVPTVVIRDATVFVTDHAPDPLPPVVVRGVRLTMLNDPVTTLKFEAHATAAPAGGPGPVLPLAVSARFHRVGQRTEARVEVPELTVDSSLAPLAARFYPAAEDVLAHLRVRVGVRAELTLTPSAPPAVAVELDLRDGRFAAPDLPHAVESASALVRLKDGAVTVERGSARVGSATAELALETHPLFGPAAAAAGLPPPDATAPDDPFAAVQSHLKRLALTVRNLTLNDDLFARLPPRAVRVRDQFRPAGTVDVSVRFDRPADGWKREVEIRPVRLAMEYEHFRYPVSDLAGWVRRVVAADGTDEYRAELTGTAGGRRVEIAGTVSGDDVDPLIRLRVAGTDVPIDDRLFRALPPKYAAALTELRAGGRGDFVADIRQDRGVNHADGAFRIRTYDGTLHYQKFPYPLARVKGDVAVRVAWADPGRPLRPGLPLAPADDTDRVEFRNFEGVHAGGTVWLEGEHEPAPDRHGRRIVLRVTGRDCPIDADLKAAAEALDLADGWRTFDPRGAVTFGATVEIPDRDGPVTADDVKLTVNFRGPSVTPSFFRYPLDEVAGVARYRDGALDLSQLTARHGESRLGLAAAEVRFGSGGEVWANLGRLTVAPLVPDAALLDALPGKLRDGVRALNPRGPMELLVRHMVVQVPPEPARPVARGSTPADPPTLPPTLTVYPFGLSAPPGLASPAVAEPASRPSPPAPSLLPPPPATADPVVYWTGELRLAGAGVTAGVDWDDLHGVVGCTGRYEGTHLGAVVGNGWLDRATVAGQPVTDARMTVQVRPQQPDPAAPGAYTPPVLEFPDLAGTLFRGTVGGEARITLAEPTRYRLWLTAADVRLDEIAAHYRLGSGAELRGLAQGKLLIENKPDPLTGRDQLAGSGQVDVPSGRMLNLPVLLPLLKLLKLQAPDQTAFEEAHAEFEVRGDRVNVTQLDLIGTAVSLGGSGELDTSGRDVRFELYTVWSQAVKRWLTGPNGADLTSVLSGNLFRIEMVKRDGGPMQYKPHVLPAVTDPLRAVAERMRVRSAERQAGTFRATGAK